MSTKALKQQIAALNAAAEPAAAVATAGKKRKRRSSAVDAGPTTKRQQLMSQLASDTVTPEQRYASNVQYLASHKGSARARSLLEKLQARKR